MARLPLESLDSFRRDGHLGQMGTEPTSAPNSFGRRLRRWRRLADIKQAHLAEHLGVSQASVSRWESGLQLPSASQRRQLDGLMRRPANSQLDEALRRLVTSSAAPVHLVHDRTHVLLCASPLRHQQWRRDAAELVGASMWRYATAEIAAAERSLADLGWREGLADRLLFQNGQRDGPPLPIVDPYILWERLLLADGTPVRLTTGLGARDAAAD